jgi:hypothetical protein
VDGHISVSRARANSVRLSKRFSNRVGVMANAALQAAQTNELRGEIGSAPVLVKPYQPRPKPTEQDIQRLQAEKAKILAVVMTNFVTSLKQKICEAIERDFADLNRSQTERIIAILIEEIQRQVELKAKAAKIRRIR